MTVLHRCLLVVVLSVAWSPLLQAQSASPDDRLRSALRDTTRKLHEAQDELATLRAELASVKQQVVVVPKACPAAPDISPRARRQIEALSAENAALRTHAEEAQKVVTQWQEAQTQWQAGLQQATQQAQANESAAKTLQEQLDQTTARERSCVAKNTQLVEIGTSLLERYRDKGLWDLFRNAEPMTQIHRVQFEMLLQEYGGKIHESQINVSEQAENNGTRN